MSIVMRVNLKSREITKTEFDRKVFFGGRGLIAKTMTEEVNPRCDPLGEKNKLIFATGVYAGYGFPTGNRLSVGTKSPLTGGIKEANVGGTLGTYFANQGIKEIIVEDISDQWLLLVVDETGKASLEDAGSYVGKGAYETVEKLYAAYGDKISACVIGPVGEKKYTAASIQVIDNATGHPARAAARGGVGAVMGSKKLKAIVIKDPIKKAELPMADAEKVKEARISLTKTAAADGAALRTGGTNVVLDMLIPMNILPVQNFCGRVLTEEEAKKVGTKAYIERANSFGGKQGAACQLGCPIQCSNIINDKNGKVITASLEYETYALAGPNCNIFDIDYLANFDRVCDDLGIDTIEAGNGIAVAMDAGYIPWGDQKKAMELLEEIGKGSGIGAALGNGAKAVGLFLGHGRVPQVKGQAFPAYDPRSLKGMGVTYATATMGADHTAGHTFSAKIDHTKPDLQVQTSQQMQVASCIIDNVCCLFGAGALFAPEAHAFAQGVFGPDIPPTFLQQSGVDTIMMERAYNTKAGVKKTEDCLPEYFRTEKTQGTKTTFDVKQYDMDWMWLPEAYRTLHGFDMPTKLYAGQGKLKAIPELLARYKAASVLLVYDKGIAKAGVVEKIQMYIDKEKYKVLEFDGVLPDPPFSSIKEAIALIGDRKIDAVLAIGGGSSMDTAKAIIAALAYPERPIDMLLTGVPYNDKTGIPLIAIPTTAGTGSEVTGGAVITRVDGHKGTVQTGPADAAILDPVLTVGLPASITVSTALDAFTHCVGGYLTVKANPLSDAFAEKGMRLVLKNLPLLLKDGTDIQAREEMAMAADLGGLVINSGVSSIDHSFAHIIGGKYHIAHGLCCAIALPFVVEFLNEAVPHKVAQLCEIFGIDTQGMVNAEIGKAVRKYLLDLNKRFEVPTLSSFPQARKEDIEELAMDTTTEMLAMFSPRKLEFDDAKDIYEEIFRV